MSQDHPTQKLVQSILKTTGPLTKRQLSYYKNSTSFQNLLSIKYPKYVISSMSHQKSMKQFLTDLECICDSFFGDKQNKKQIFLRKACQFFFTAEQKKYLNKVLDRQFGQQTRGAEQSSSAKKIYQILQFVFIKKRDQ